MKIAIVNGMKGTDREMPLIREALETYGAQVAISHCRPESFSCDTMTAPQVRLLAPGEPVPTDEVPFHLDERCDVEDAAGYHDKYKTGQPYVIVGRDAAKNGELLRGDGDSVLEIAQHELAELMGNPKVNRWLQSSFLDKSTGKTYSLTCPELCDPLQGVYDTMTLSDGTKVGRVAWAYPEFFEQERVQSTQLDSHGAASEPLVILPGGYQIVATIGRESQVFGMRATKPGRVDVCEHHQVKMSAEKRMRKFSPSSRTMRIVNSLV